MARILDLRGLPHPSRPPLVFNTLASLGQGEELVVLVEIEPVPLYTMLRQKGYVCKGAKQADNSWRVEIRKAIKSA